MARKAERSTARPSSPTPASGRRRAALRIALLAAAATGRFVQAAPPSGRNIPAPLQQLAQALAKQGARSTPFVERRFSSLLRAPIETRGTLSFTPPDRLERTITSPRRETVIIKGSSLTVQGDDGTRARTMRIDAHPALAAFADSLRATLAGDLDALQQHFSIEMRGTLAQWTLTLLPFDAAVKEAVQSVRITGQQADVRRVEVHEPGGDRTELSLGTGS